MRHLSALGVILVLLLACNSAVGQILHIHNDMDSGVWLWMKSETKKDKKDWNRWFIPRDTYKDVTLVSPDRFQVVVDDRDGARHSAGLMALRAMIAQNPDGVLEVGGIMRAVAEQYYAYCPQERRWRLFTRQRNVRVAVTFTLFVNGQAVHYEEVP